MVNSGWIQIYMGVTIKTWFGHSLRHATSAEVIKDDLLVLVYFTFLYLSIASSCLKKRENTKTSREIFFFFKASTTYCLIILLGTGDISWLDILLYVLCESVNTVVASRSPCSYCWGKLNTCLFDISWKVCGKVTNQIYLNQIRKL